MKAGTQSCDPSTAFPNRLYTDYLSDSSATIHHLECKLPKIVDGKTRHDIHRPFFSLHQPPNHEVPIEDKIEKCAST
jgi:hypothetical protein